MAAPNVLLQPLPLFEIASWHQSARKKLRSVATVGFVIGAQEGQDVTIASSSPIILGDGDAIDEALTIERLRLVLKVKSMFQGRRRVPEVVGWYFCGAPAPAAALADLQQKLWPLAQAAVIFPEPNDDNDKITHYRDVRVSCVTIDSAVCVCVDDSNQYSTSALLVSSTCFTTNLSLQPKRVTQETAVVQESSIKISDPLPSHLSQLSDSIQLLSQKIAQITSQIENQISSAAPCSRALRRRAASILHQLQRLQSLSLSDQLGDVAANVDAARSLQALFGSTAQLQKLLATTSLRH